jgi:hypothetical protein
VIPDAVLLEDLEPLIVKIRMAMVSPDEFILIRIELSLQG